MLGMAGLEALDGLRNGARGAWDGSLGRLGVRNPLGPRVRAGMPRPGLLLLAALAALAAAAYVLHRRKRRQVTEHYNMGAAPGVPDTGNASEHVPAAESAPGA